jgi:hypothetical protein
MSVIAKKSLKPTSVTTSDEKEEAKLYSYVLTDEEASTMTLPLGPSTLKLVRSSLLRGGTHYRTRIGLVGSMTTSGTGAINSTITNASLAGVAEFVSFSAVFDEFFIHGFTAEYKPFNQFQTNPSSSLPSALYASGMILGAPLYHGAASYASATAMASNIHVRCLSTASPFDITWKNNESSKSTVVTSSSTSAPTATQSWCLTSASSAALYQGLYQFRTNTVLANVISTTVGDFLIRWDVSFRARA